MSTWLKEALQKLAGASAHASTGCRKAHFYRELLISQYANPERIPRPCRNLDRRPRQARWRSRTR